MSLEYDEINVLSEKCRKKSVFFHETDVSLFPFQAGLSAAPARAVSAVKNMNIPQQLKDMKFSDLPTISGLKF